MRRGLLATSLGVAGVGAAVGRPAVTLLAAVPLAVLAVGAVTAPDTPAVSVSRELSTTAPTLGDRVTVRVVVENEGATIEDCLVEDSPPPETGVDGSPVRSVRLPAGATTTLEYEVIAGRGTHEFGDVSVTARGLTESSTATEPVESSYRCRADGSPLQLHAPTTRRLGDRTADAGGSGVEFYAVREYRPSDSHRRIDWRRYARSRELTTVEFGEESATVLRIVVDARETGAVRSAPRAPTALAYCADAAERLAYAFTDRETAVGVGLYPDDLEAIPPGTGRPHRTKIRQLFEDGSPPTGTSAGRTARPDGGDGTTAAGSRTATVGGLSRADGRHVVVTPLLDDEAAAFVASLHQADVDVGVVAPDVGGDGPGAVVERALRAARVARLRGAGVPLADWDVDEPLERAVEEVFATWT